jgi:hypothetical protein
MKVAVTQIHAISTTLNKAIDYISNPNKTEGKLLISGFHCTPEMATAEFNFTKKNADKKGGRLAYHLIQSFAPGEVEYAMAHDIGRQFAKELLRGRHEFIIATHTDRQHVHNHVIFNSVSFVDDKKFHGAADIFHRIQRISDKLCRENGLSVIQEKSGVRGKSYKEYTADKQEKSWKTALREAIDCCIRKAKDWEEFLALMEAEKYEVKRGKHVAFRAEGQKKFTRAKSLGNRYTEAKIKSQLRGEVKGTFINTSAVPEKPKASGLSLLMDIENNVKAKQSAGLKDWLERKNLKMAAMTINYLSDNGLMDYKLLSAKRESAKTKRDSTLLRIKEVESRIRELNAVIKDLDTFRKTKPVVERLDKVVFKEKYRREHETDFILHEAAKQSLNAHFPDKKYPLIKTLRAELAELYDEKKQLYPEYYAAKDEFRDVDVMVKNVDSIIGRNPHEQERERSRKQNKDEIE